jgi:hypothetical protein
LIRIASPDNINAISELALNTLKGNVKLNLKQKSKLKKFKKSLRKLANKRFSVKSRKSLLLQEGGFLPILIAPVLSALAGLAGKAVGNALGI